MKFMFYIIILILSICPKSLFSKVILTEVMFDPIGSESSDEFIEINNISQTEQIDLSGWRIGDGTGNDEIMDAGEGLLLSPGQYGLIVDPDYLVGAAIYDSLIPVEALILTIDGTTLGSGGLSNSKAEAITLIDDSGTIMFQYIYSPGNISGYSDEKIDYLNTDDTNNWSDSKVLNGTPGFKNSVAKCQRNLSVSQIWIEPDRIRGQEETTLFMTIVNSGIEPISEFAVALFNDINYNSVYETEERIGFLSEDLLIQSGDSVIIYTVLSNLLSGIQSIKVEVILDGDENLDDNIYIRELVVGFFKNDLIINEIMFEPVSNQAEWIELFNPGIHNINLKGCKFSDSDTSKKIIINSGNVIIDSNGYMVIASDSSILSYLDLDCDYLIMDNFPGLNNDKDTIFFFDPTDLCINRVDYQRDWGGGNGVSIELINSVLNSSDAANWKQCTLVEGMTPGRKNSVYSEVIITQSKLTVSPDPFSPDEDGFEDFTIITYSLPMVTSYINLRIYDLKGRCIRSLRGASPSGAHASVVWDGKDNYGRFARIGIYIVFLEGLNASMGFVTSSKTTIVLAGRL
jgi:hypothetical protein